MADVTGLPVEVQSYNMIKEYMNNSKSEIIRGFGGQSPSNNTNLFSSSNGANSTSSFTPFTDSFFSRYINDIISKLLQDPLGRTISATATDKIPAKGENLTDKLFKPLVNTDAAIVAADKNTIDIIPLDAFERPGLAKVATPITNTDNIFA